MAVTQEEIDAQTAVVAGLEQMLADGVRQVTIGDQTLTYNTTDSLLKARDDAQAKLNGMKASFSGQRRGTVTYFQFAGRGY